jgi:signal peptidase I
MDDQHDPSAFASARPSGGPAAPWAPESPDSSGLPGRDPADDGPARDARGRGRHASRGSSGHEADAEDAKSAPAGKKRKNFWRELLIIVVAAAALTLLVKAFIVQVYKIPSASMENTLQVNDRVLVNKLVYHFRGIARGDIIVFSGQDSWGPDATPPSSDPVVRIWDDVLSGIGLQSSQTYYIKRVIGLPGDHVACCTDGKVTVNGVPLTENSYLYPGAQPSFPFKAVTVPADHVWVMGDNRGDSEDSRYHMTDPGGGAIPENEVVGRAFMIIWPPSAINDLPIPSTFGQAALHSGAAGAAVFGAEKVGGTALSAVAAVPVAGAAGAAGVIGAPVLLLRRRVSRRRVRRVGRGRRGCGRDVRGRGDEEPPGRSGLCR